MTGEALRDAGIEQAGSGVAVALLFLWHAKALDNIALLATAEADFSAEDIRKAIGDPPVSNLMGAVFMEACRKGWIVPAGYGKASRPSRHASIIRYWRGK